jgi:hypothetical protein
MKPDEALLAEDGAESAGIAVVRLYIAKGLAIDTDQARSMKTGYGTYCRASAWPADYLRWFAPQCAGESTGLIYYERRYLAYWQHRLLFLIQSEWDTRMSRVADYLCSVAGERVPVRPHHEAASMRHGWAEPQRGFGGICLPSLEGSVFLPITLRRNGTRQRLTRAEIPYIFTDV